MKKIGIITFHQALNYGAMLQAYALQAYINGHFAHTKAEIVDYRCEKLSGFYTLKENRQNCVVKSIKALHFLLKKAKFDAFAKKFIPLSDQPYTAQTIARADTVYDQFLTGSDQVWNPELSGSDLNYLLQFAAPHKRFSYAASIGLDALDEQLQEPYKALLSTYDRISVREASAKALLERLGLEKEIRVHVDPTLLLEQQAWSDVCRHIKPRKKAFVLVYAVAYSPELISQAAEFAQRNGLEVLYIGPRTTHKGVKYIPSISLDRLLALFRDAQYVFENSFHGTVFSVIFHKKFYAYLPFSDGRNSRITNLLSILDLQPRMKPDHIFCDVDWDKVDERLLQERRSSQDYLEWVVGHNN